MKKTKITKILSVALCFMLVALIAIFANGCKAKKTAPADSVETSAKTTESTTNADEGTTKEDKTAAQNSSEEITKLGKGEKTFTFTVKDADRKETVFEIKSDKKTVGEALEEQGLISGKESQYGLMVDTVMGIRADYDKDKAYWALYIGGEYAQTGVDQTELVEGENYMLEYTEG